MIHILNLGLGVDSTSILLSWIYKPKTRPFNSLDELLLITAQTGNEHQSTKRLVETHILPLLRQHQIRFVQVAKAGHSKRDGYTVLSDTRNPRTCHIEGDYTLGHSLKIAGTSQPVSGAHTCAMKFKGAVIDQWIVDHLSGEAIGPYLGYCKGEEKRSAKCADYPCMGSDYRFPLQEWGWDRETCIDYIRKKTGANWLKSACVFCPFCKPEQAGQRWESEPEAGLYALTLEAAALALNPRMKLFASRSAWEIAPQFVRELAVNHLDSIDWAVYRVERIYQGKQISRRVMRVSEPMPRRAADAQVSVIAKQHGCACDTSDPTYTRAYEYHRKPSESLTCEGFWVAAPGFIQNKVHRPNYFEQTWREATGKVKQLSLV